MLGGDTLSVLFSLFKCRENGIACLGKIAAARPGGQGAGFVIRWSSV